MAGDWIPMRTGLADDPAVIAIAARLGLDEDSVVGKLHRVWSWANHQTLDGHAPSVTSVWLDRYARAPGFADALAEAGWLEVTETGLWFPKFDRYNSEPAKKRALAAKRQSRRRHANRHAPSATQALPEKRREEKKETTPQPPGESAVSPDVRRLDVPAAFLRFWAAWPKHPRKAAKGKCAELWAKKKLEAQAEHIVAVVQAMKLSEDWTKEDGQYIPGPLGWLRQEKWDGVELDAIQAQTDHGIVWHETGAVPPPADAMEELRGAGLA